MQNTEMCVLLEASDLLQHTTQAQYNWNPLADFAIWEGKNDVSWKIRLLFSWISELTLTHRQ